jgi:hypothetical protein
MIADAHRVESTNLLVKIVLGAILISATMLGVSELASAVTRADHGSLPAAVNDISVRN